MVAGLRQTSFNSAGLIRLLAELTVADGADSKQSFAERLSQWLNWTDAISLSVALDGSVARASAGRSRGASSASGAAAEFARVRAALADSMAEPIASESIATEADYLPYRQHYVARQRMMESGIGPLRTEVRAALAGLSANASRLAAIDAVLDEVLSAREQRLLSTVPALLEKHFERLRAAPAGEWLAVYRRDMQAVLLAELELRLQPVEGLLEALQALHHEPTRPQ